MADYYVDPAAGGANDGGGDGVADDPTDTDNWTDAWVDIQSAFDTAVAGDVVYCRGTQTLTAIIDVDTNEGDLTSGMIRFIGVEGLLGITGTRFVFDGNSAVANCLDSNSMDFIHLENFEFKNATGNGVDASVLSNNWVFNNCSFNNNGALGIDCPNFNGSTWIRCTAYLNTTDGFFRPTASSLLLCSSHDNTGSGMGSSARFAFHAACLLYDNGDDGYENLALNSVLFNCVINGNTDDGVISFGNTPIVIGCRITNHSGAGDIGLNCNGDPVFHGWNYYEDNDGANIQNATLAIEILDDGATTDVEDQADTNEGYTDLTDGAEDFNLRSDATSRRTAITIPTV